LTVTNKSGLDAMPAFTVLSDAQQLAKLLQLNGQNRIKNRSNKDYCGEKPSLGYFQEFW
jgi:hypothetical protein